jgi:hypothetical protein
LIWFSIFSPHWGQVHIALKWVDHRATSNAATAPNPRTHNSAASTHLQRPAADIKRLFTLALPKSRAKIHLFTGVCKASKQLTNLSGLHQARLGQCWREGRCGFQVHFSDWI